MFWFSPPDVERIRTTEKRKWLFQLLSYTKDARVRSAAARRFGELREDSALGPLVTMLSNDIDPDVRESAALALGCLRNLSDTFIYGLRALTSAALKDQCRAVRHSAVASLQGHGNLLFLIEAIEYEESRDAALDTLIQLGDNAVGHLYYFLKLKERSEPVCDMIAQLLLKIGSPKAIKSLLEIERSFGFTSTTYKAATRVLTPENLKGVPDIVNILVDVWLTPPTSGVVFVLHLLEQMGAVDPLIAALGMKNGWVTTVDTTAAGYAWDGIAGAVVERREVKEFEGDSRHLIVRALGNMGDKRAIEVLRNELKSGNEPDRVAAREALRKLGA